MFSRSNLLTLLFVIAAVSTVGAQTGWTGLSTPGNADLVAVYFTSDRTGWVAGDGGFMAVTNDGGRNWSKVPLNLTEDINEIYFRNESDGYLVAGRKMLITKDGGRSWIETRIYGSSEFRGMTPEFLSIRFADKKRGIAVCSLLRKVKNEDVVVDSLVMRTDDGG